MRLFCLITLGTAAMSIAGVAWALCAINSDDDYFPNEGGHK